jgi:hypothetical protein
MGTLLREQCAVFEWRVGNLLALEAAGDLRKPLEDARFAVLTLIHRIGHDINLSLGQGQGGPVRGALGNGDREQGQRGLARGGHGGAFARGGHAQGQGGPVPGGRAQGQRGLARGGHGGALAHGGYAHGGAVAYEAPVRSWLAPDFLRFRDGSCLVDPDDELTAMKDAEISIRDNACDQLRERAKTLAGHFKSVRRHVRAFDRELRRARALSGHRWCRRHHLEARLAHLRALREKALPRLEDLRVHIDAFCRQRIVFPHPRGSLAYTPLLYLFG